MASCNFFAITAPTTTVPDVQRRIQLLLCLKQAQTLPHLPLELVEYIAKDVTLEVYICCECNAHIVIGRQYAGAGTSVYCSSACFEDLPQELIDLVVVRALVNGIPVRPMEFRRESI